MPTFASLFTGFGLADIGAMMAGCELLWGIDLDPAIAEVAKSNLPHQDQIYIQSVIATDFKNLEVPDILWASPPCPSFSVAKVGAVETPLDKALAAAIVDAISVLQPQAFILENVEGYKKSESLKLIESALYHHGYWVDRQILNSADFGVPQTRQRLILRAVKGFVPALPQKQKWVGWYQAIADLVPDLPESHLAQWQIDRLPDALLKILTDGKPSHLPKAILIDALLISGTPSDHCSTVAFRESHEPALSVTKSADRQVSKVWLSPSRVVRLNSRGLARFQTVPDWYELPERNPLACRGVGNGVPCLLSQQVILSILP